MELARADCSCIRFGILSHWIEAMMAKPASDALRLDFDRGSRPSSTPMARTSPRSPASPGNGSMALESAARRGRSCSTWIRVSVRRIAIMCLIDTCDHHRLPRKAGAVRYDLFTGGVRLNDEEKSRIDGSKLLWSMGKMSV